MMTKQTVRDSFDNKVLRWAGAGMLMFVVAAFASAAVGGRAEAGVSGTPACEATAAAGGTTGGRC